MSTRSDYINFRVTPEEKRKILNRAAAAGMGWTDYCRAKLLDNESPFLAIDERLSAVEKAVSKIKE